MADRAISVTLKANIAGYMASLRTAGRQTKEFGDTVSKNKQAADHLGQGMVAFGGAVVGGLALATKAAIDWESAWTGVTKTVDGSAEQMAHLEGQLRGMARSLPASHQEIAAVAEAAGQLGIKRDSIAGFTKTMIDLGVSTNLSAEDAATSIAQMANIMGTSQDDVDRMGSALVALGNAGASTEAEILEMSHRLAGAGALIGASEADIMALANAMASIGISAEAGGGSMSRTMQKIYIAVQEGADSVEGFAKVAGVSAQEFAAQFQKDPVAAVNSFIQGLNRVEAAGGNVVGTLQELGIRSSEDLRTVLGLKGATDLLADSLKLGSKAWKENNALTEEANKRYDTAASRIKVAWNQIQDAAIDVGGAIAPIITEIAEGVGGLAEAFASLPGPVKTVLAALGGLAGITALFGGGMLLLLPRIAETKQAISDLGLNTGRMSGKLRDAKGTMYGLGLAAAGVTAIMSGLTIAGQIFLGSIGEFNADANALSDALLQWQKNGKASGEAARLFGDDMSGLSDAIQLVTEGGIGGWAKETSEWFANLVGASGELGDAREQIASLDKALAQMVTNGNGKQAFDFLRWAAESAGVSVDEIRKLLPSYSEAASKAGDQTKEAGKKIGQVGGQVEQVNPELEALARHFRLAGDDAEEAAQEMLEEWAKAFTEFAPMVGAYQAALEAKQAAEEESAKSTADSLGKEEGAGKSWEDFVGDVKLTVAEYLAELEKMAENQRNWSANMIRLAGRIPPAMLDELARMGPEGADLVALMNEMTDAELRKNVELWRQTGAESGTEFANRLKDADPILRAIADQLGQGVANKIRDGMAKRGTTVQEEARRQGLRIDRGVDVNRPRIVKVRADTSQAENQVRNAVRRMNNRLAGLEDTTVKVRAQFTYGGFKIPKYQSDTGYAEGGKIHGPGGPKDDIIPIWASSGEFMQPTEAVNYYGVGFMEAIRKKRIPRGWDGAKAPGFAEGGLVAGDAMVRYLGSQSGVNSPINLAAFGPLAWREFMSSGMVGMGGGGGYGGGVERWRSVALAALAYTGSPPSWIESLLRRMNQESGGNQFAINLWDSNAAAGIPSKGLMQTIDPTFYGYAGELAGRGVYDPFANIVASIRYANARYGAAPIGWNRPGGYRYGTDHVPADGFYKLHRGEEVRPADRRQSRGDLNLRITGGQLEIVDRNGALVGMMRNVAVQEIDDHSRFVGRR